LASFSSETPIIIKITPIILVIVNGSERKRKENISRINPFKLYIGVTKDVSPVAREVTKE
jgi:hypothetical protein